MFSYLFIVCFLWSSVSSGKSELSAFNTWTYRADSLKLGCLILLEKNTIYFFPASEWTVTVIVATGTSCELRISQDAGCFVSTIPPNVTMVPLCPVIFLLTHKKLVYCAWTVDPVPLQSLWLFLEPHNLSNSHSNGLHTFSYIWACTCACIYST